MLTISGLLLSFFYFYFYYSWCCAVWRPYIIIVQVIFYFLWDHCAHPDYFENRIPLKPVLEGVCSLANYNVAYEETQSNRVSDCRVFVCSLCSKGNPFLLLFYYSRTPYYTLYSGVHVWIFWFVIMAWVPWPQLHILHFGLSTRFNSCCLETNSLLWSCLSSLITLQFHIRLLRFFFHDDSYADY